MKGRFVSLMAVGGLLLTSCGGDDSSSDDDTASPQRVEDETLRFEFAGCNQVAYEFTAERAAARQLVPDGFDLHPSNGTEATMWHWAKDCDDLIVGGQSVGAGMFDAIMVQIVGPPEMRESETRPDLAANDVDYQYPILWITDNADFQRETAAFGTAMVLADEMTFEVSEGSVHTGSAVARGNAPPIDYSWATTDDLPWSPGSDRFIAHTAINSDAAAIYTYEIDAVLNPTWSGRAVELDLGDTALAAALGSEITGFGYGMILSAIVDADRESTAP